MALLSRKMPHVAILLSSAYGEHTRLLRGILHFTQMNAPWSLDVRMGRAGEPEGFVSRQRVYDGIIANYMPPDLAAIVSRYHTPTILLNDIWPEGSPLGRIKCDSATIACMAADYLVNCGFRRFAFVGERSGLDWSSERERAFADELGKRGFDCAVYDKGHETGSGGKDDLQKLQEWLVRLPRPTAVFPSTSVSSSS